MKSETVNLGETRLAIHYPSSYESSGGRRFPLLLAYGELGATECAARLHVEGILPEMVIVEIPVESSGTDPALIMKELSKRIRLLDSPAARWIAASGHEAIRAFATLLDHPDLFGRAACLSSSFEGPAGAPPLHSPMLRHLEERTSFPSNLRLFYDYGTIGLDECYEPYHRDLGCILRSKGWNDGREFQIIRSLGGMHTAESWRVRLEPALRWLAAS